MGRKKTAGADLPPRMLRKNFRNSKKPFYYYCGLDRKQIPLGPDLRIALSKYRSLHVGTGSHAPIATGFFRKLYKLTLKRSKRRSLPCTLDEIFLEQLMEEQDGKCALSGIKFASNVYPGQRIRPWLPSVDRKNSGLGYTRENVRLVCAAVNLARNQFGDAVFYQIAVGTAKNRKLLIEGFDEERSGTGKAS